MCTPWPLNSRRSSMKNRKIDYVWSLIVHLLIMLKVLSSINYFLILVFAASSFYGRNSCSCFKEANILMLSFLQFSFSNSLGNRNLLLQYSSSLEFRAKWILLWNTTYFICYAFGLHVCLNGKYNISIVL